MESSVKQEASVIGMEQFNLIEAHLIVEGSPDDIEHSVIELVDVPDIIHDQVSNTLFSRFFESVKELNSKEINIKQRNIWVDVRSEKVKSKENGVALALFIACYGSGKETEIARAFKKYKEFKRFRPVIENLELNKKFDIESLNVEV